MSQGPFWSRAAAGQYPTVSIQQRHDIGYCGDQRLQLVFAQPQNIGSAVSAPLFTLQEPQSNGSQRGNAGHHQCMQSVQAVTPLHKVRGKCVVQSIYLSTQLAHASL